MRAVWPRISFSRVVSSRPGTCTRIRSAPCAWIDGSVVPSAFRRRSRTCTLCVTAERSLASIPASVIVSGDPVAVPLQLHLVGGRLPEDAGACRGGQRLERRHGLLAVRRVTQRAA